MQRFDLDFSPSHRGPRWTAICLLAISSLVTAKLVDIYATAKTEAEHLQTRVAQFERRASGGAAHRAEIPEAMRKEIRHVNELIDQIALPWDRLFNAVDAASSNKVALLGITPDQQSGTVEIKGECADLATMFDYVKRLDQQTSLGRVFLLNHQINAQDRERPVRFTITASWMQPSSRL